MSRLTLVLAVVGCLYAVTAQPPIGHLGGLTKDIERGVDGTIEFETLPTDILMHRAYGKLFTLVDENILSIEEQSVLRECLFKFLCAIEKRTVGEIPEIEFQQLIERLRILVKRASLNALVIDVSERHVSVLNTLTETEIEHLRTILIKFLNDPTPDIMYYIEHGWSTAFDRSIEVLSLDKPIEHVLTEESSFKEFLSEFVRKFAILRDSVWSTKKIEVAHLIVKCIKRADEELLKYDQIEKVEELIERMPYESLNTLPLQKLVEEFELRIEALFEGVWTNQSVTLKTYLIDFLKNIEKQIVKYNRIE